MRKILATSVALVALLSVVGESEAATHHHRAAAAWPGVPSNPSSFTPFGVTGYPLVQAYVGLAEAFWQETPACGAITVTVSPLPDAWNGYTTVPGSTLGAVTDNASCVILISASTWGFFLDPHQTISTLAGTDPEPGSTYDCLLLAHEYAHSLGMPDGPDDDTMLSVGAPFAPALDPSCAAF